MLYFLSLWARSLVGRAPVLHTGGQEFESPRVHQMKQKIILSFFLLFLLVPNSLALANTPITRFAQCWEAINNCRRVADQCRDRLYKDGLKCNERYDRDINNCRKHTQRGADLILRCQRNLNTCLDRVPRAKDPIAAENQCRQKMDTCIYQANLRIDKYNQLTDQCLSRSEYRKRDCQAKFLNSFPRRLANCERNLISCSTRVERRCDF